MTSKMILMHRFLYLVMVVSVLFVTESCIVFKNILMLKYFGVVWVGKISLEYVSAFRIPNCIEMELVCT